MKKIEHRVRFLVSDGYRLSRHRDSAMYPHKPGEKNPQEMEYNSPIVVEVLQIPRRFYVHKAK